MAGESQSLYRKYRPRSFDEDELVGQEAVARTLRNAIQSGRVAHAYLFCGPRGTGKTTTARLLARAVNCQHPDPARRPCNECRACRTIGVGENQAMDIIEIDAASNRGIDDIRDLREKINFAPSELTYKFYIIDEVHQLSEAAANALLKTLEEPPPHAKFVLATTDPQKMLETIVSRCQMFRFRRIPLDRMVARLRHVCTAEGLTADDDALALMARQATGSLRDALGLLDKVAAYGETGITVETVRQALGIHGDERVITLVDAALANDLAAALSTVSAVVEEGVEPRLFTQQVVEYLRELLLRLAGGASPAAGIAPARDTAQERQVAGASLAAVADLVQRLSAIDYALERGAYGSLPLELALVEVSLARGAATAAPAPRPLRPAPERSAPERPILEPPAAERPAPMARDPKPEPEQPAPLPPEITSPQEPARFESVSVPATLVATSLPAGQGITPEQLVAMWQLVMRDLNTHHKRVHALLREADPILVDGDMLVLSAAYEFHHRQINQDAIRTVIEQTIEQHAKQPLRLRCILASEAAPYRARASAAPIPDPPSSAADTSPAAPVDRPGASSLLPIHSLTALAASPPQTSTGAVAEPEPNPADDEARIKAAANIFNARPVS